MQEDQERQKQEEHWRELAALLGVEAGPPSVGGAAKETPPKDVTVPAPARVPPPVAQFQEAAEATSPLEEIESRGSYETEEDGFASFAEEREEPAPAAAEVETREVETRADREEATEDRPRRGRRRRGRRDRKEGHGRREPRDQAPTPVDEPAEDELDEQEFRGGSRQRPDEEEPAPATEDDEEIEPAAEEPERDDEEDDTLSDWNVPSWTELIASLYRPER